MVNTSVVNEANGRLQTNYRPLIILVLVAFALRVVWALLIPVDPVSDSFAYHVFATNIVEHGVYGWTPDEPGAYWPVGTSAIVAGLYYVFGQQFGWVVGFNIVVSVLVVIQGFWLARHYFDETTAVLTAAILALWPSLIMYSSLIASEVFFIFFMLAGLIAFESKKYPILFGMFIAGLLWAAAVYVRPVAVLVPAGIAFSHILGGRRAIGYSLLRVAVVYVLIFASLAPWTARNETVFGERVMVSTNFGPVFWMGNNPDTTGEYQSLPARVDDLSETERASLLKEEALDFVRAEPLAFLQRTARKFVMLHSRETIAVAWNANQLKERFGQTSLPVLKAVATGFWWVVLLAAIIGLRQIWKRDGISSMLLHPGFLGWMYIAWIHAIIILGDRYHIPAIPFVALLAGLGIASILHRPRGTAQ